MSQASDPQQRPPAYQAASPRPPVDPNGAFPPPFPPSGGGYGPPTYGPPRPPRGPGGSIFMRIAMVVLFLLLLGSIGMNFVLAALVGLTHLHGGNLVETTYADGDMGHRIEIVPVSGVITDETAEFIHEALEKLDAERPAAIVLRVDSPGGGVAASDRIAHELSEFRKNTKIPIVASFGSEAASGGYYISAMADHIVAEPTCLTGSIGVIAEAFTFEKLMDKVGVTPETITSKAAIHKDDLSPFHAWNDADRAELRDILDQAHERFVSVVFEGRKDKKLSMEQVTALATGQVFTTKDAITAKLVDEEGYLGAAIKKAAALAGIDPSVTPEVKILKKTTPFSLLSATASVPDPKALTAEQVRRWMSEMATLRLEYRAR